MPVVGVASKLRQPSVVSTKPVHTALPIPSAVRAAASQGFMARQRDLGPGNSTPALNCQLSARSEYQQERRTAGGKARAESEESKICKVSGGLVYRPAAQVSGCQLPLGCSRCLSSSVADFFFLHSSESFVLRWNVVASSTQRGK